MTILVGFNKLNKKIKIIIFIVLVSCLTLLLERIIGFIRTFNPYYDLEKVVENSIDYIENKKFRNHSDDIIFTTKVNEKLSLLENTYHVEKKLEYEQLKQLNCNPQYSVDEESLHDDFLKLQSQFEWDLWKEQSFFYRRMRDTFNKKSLRFYKESSPSIVLFSENNGKSFYYVCNNFYKEGNSNRNYFMIQIYMQNNDEFVYMSHFEWGELTGLYNETQLKDKMLQSFDEYFK